MLALPPHYLKIIGCWQKDPIIITDTEARCLVYSRLTCGASMAQLAVWGDTQDTISKQVYKHILSYGPVSLFVYPCTANCHQHFEVKEDKHCFQVILWKTVCFTTPLLIESRYFQKCANQHRECCSRLFMWSFLYLLKCIIFIALSRQALKKPTSLRSLV